MALSNVIPGTYAVIDNVHVSYKDRKATFDLVVYQDNTKEHVLFKNSFLLEELAPHAPCEDMVNHDINNLPMGIWVYCYQTNRMFIRQYFDPCVIPDKYLSTLIKKDEVLKGCYDFVKSRGIYPLAEDA